jgi:hypothetical protein
LLAAASPPVSKAILLRFARQRLRLRGTISARICCLRPLTAISLTPRSASACCNPHSCGAAVPCGLVQHVFSPPARIKSSHATALSWPRRCAKNALHSLKTLCIMGNFRNGELATRCSQGSVDFGDLTLHYGPPLGPAISCREVKGFVSADQLAQRPQWLRASRRDPVRRQISVVAGFSLPIHDDPQRRPCVAP